MFHHSSPAGLIGPFREGTMELQAGTNVAGTQHTSHPVIERAAWHKPSRTDVEISPGLFAWHTIPATGAACHPGQQSDCQIHALAV